jgi:hypothetical protein
MGWDCKDGSITLFIDTALSSRDAQRSASSPTARRSSNSRDPKKKSGDHPKVVP